MHKIPTLFKRDYDGTRLVYNEVTEGCEWVLAGEGWATDKIDGTACLIRNGILYKRYDAKNGRTPPEGFEPLEAAPDPVTGHWLGWTLVGDGNEDKYHREAWETLREKVDGTYELIGPKIQGNPYGYVVHMLIPHGEARLEGVFEPPRDYDGLKRYLSGDSCGEGIVWYHPDGRMAKLKRRDFGHKWPVEK